MDYPQKEILAQSVGLNRALFERDADMVLTELAKFMVAHNLEASKAAIAQIPTTRKAVA